MDPFRFDRLARHVGMGAGRRTLVRGLLALAGLAALGPTGAEAGSPGKRGDRKRRKGDPSADVAATRKRRKRKKKTPRCEPNCDRRACGADGCGGSCGACQAPTTCDTRGRCVGCENAPQCATIACRDAACAAGICTYAAAVDGGTCGGGRNCCGGDCVDLRTDRDHCGGCGRACGAGEACFGGRCFPACDVCASGCAFSSVQAAVDAAAPGATVTLCPGTYTGTVAIGKNLTLLGLGDGPADTVLTNPSEDILQVEAGASVTARNLSFTGVSAFQRFAVRNQGTLTLREAHIFGNAVIGEKAISNRAFLGAPSAVLTLIDCSIRDNAPGGAIGNGFGCVVTLVRTRIERNEGPQGAGVSNIGTVNVTDGSVITGNTAVGTGIGIFGGGIWNGGTVTIDATSSITGNDPDDCVDVGSGTGCPV